MLLLLKPTRQIDSTRESLTPTKPTTQVSLTMAVSLLRRGILVGSIWRTQLLIFDFSEDERSIANKLAREEKVSPQ